MYDQFNSQAAFDQFKAQYQPDFVRLADYLVRAVGESGGGTVSPWGAVPTRGLAVSSRKDLEVQVTIDDATLAVPAIVPALHALHEHVTKPWHHFGIWLDESTGILYLDLVEVLPDVSLEHAIKAAKEAKQLAIYHLTTKTTLRLE